MSGEGAKPKAIVELVKDYLFRVTFPGSTTNLIMGELPPLGEFKGPNASRVLSAAVANCLSASLAFCLRKSKVELQGIRAEAEPILERNKEGYWRITKINVRIKPTIAETVDQNRIRRCPDIFEYCVATGAVREGIQVDVHVDA